MKKASVLASSFIFLFSILLSPNCATLITRSRKQIITVTSSPAGAKVIVNGVEQDTTPLMIRLARKQKGQVIRIEYPGYKPFEIRMKRSVSVPAAANVILGVWVGYYVSVAIALGSHRGGWPWLPCMVGAIGTLIGIDLASGHGYTLSPSDLTVILTKADGTPRVDTLFVDADDFRNVKWIRVHRD